MRLAIIKDGIVQNLVEGDFQEVAQIFSDSLVMDPGASVVYIGGVWTGEQFEPPPTPPMDTTKIYSDLWQAAHDYEYQQVSGSAVGLLAVGVMLGKPKCTAVQNWIKSIWALYYERKAQVSPYNKPSYNFSVCGQIPYTVPELMEELYG